MPVHRPRRAAFQAHGVASSERVDAAHPAQSFCFASSRGRSIGYELLDNARVFSELSHDVVRLIDAVENTSSKLVSPATMDHQQTQHFSTRAEQILKGAQHGSATCKHIDTVIADSVDRIRQGIIVMEQAGFQMLQTIDAVIQGAEVNAFMGGSQQPAFAHPFIAAPDTDDTDSRLLHEEVVLAVQDLKNWALVLKRNLQVLRLSGHDDEVAMACPSGDGGCT